ncbi:MAG: GNAT family N-acetyltransferase [Spirochaetaceae bacterium]
MDIKLISKNDKEALFDFEVRNRDWFEQSVPPRPTGYFKYESFSNIIDSLLAEQLQGLCYLYVIYQNNKIVGRVNISAINSEVGDIGYRVCKDHIGQGIGTKALRFLIKNAKDVHGLKSLTAKTTPDNYGSQRVMEKCGFNYVKTEKNAGTLNNKSIDFVCYQLHICSI